jgi:hypothetical protein
MYHVHSLVGGECAKRTKKHASRITRRIWEPIMITHDYYSARLWADHHEEWNAELAGTLGFVAQGITTVARRLGSFAGSAHGRALPGLAALLLSGAFISAAALPGWVSGSIARTILA